MILDRFSGSSLWHIDPVNVEPQSPAPDIYLMHMLPQTYSVGVRAD